MLSVAFTSLSVDFTKKTSRIPYSAADPLHDGRQRNSGVSKLPWAAPFTEQTRVSDEQCPSRFDSFYSLA